MWTSTVGHFVAETDRLNSLKVSPVFSNKITNIISYPTNNLTMSNRPTLMSISEVGVSINFYRMNCEYNHF